MIKGQVRFDSKLVKEQKSGRKEVGSPRAPEAGLVQLTNVQWE